MYKKLDVEKKTIGTDLKIDFIESGNIYDIYFYDTRVKQLISNNFETSFANIFLRLEKNGEVSIHNLIGVGSNSKFMVENNKAYYKGNANGVNYTVIISVVERTYFFEVKLEKTEGVKLNVFYGMDFCISNKYAVRNNEA